MGIQLKDIVRFILLFVGTILLLYGVLFFFKREKIIAIYKVEVPTESLYNENIQDPNPDLIPFEDPQTHLYGYKSPSGAIAITPSFIRALPFSKSGIANVYVVDSELAPSGNFFIINRSGNILVRSFFYDNGPDYFLHNLSRFVENNQIGFINKEGKKVIAAQFDAAFPFHYNKPIAVVGKNIRKEQIDAQKNNSFKGPPDQRIDFEYSTSAYEETKIFQNRQWGAIDNQGNIIVPIVYDRFENGTIDNPQAILTFYQGDQACKLYYDAQRGQYTLKQ